MRGHDDDDHDSLFSRSPSLVLKVGETLLESAFCMLRVDVLLKDWPLSGAHECLLADLTNDRKIPNVVLEGAVALARRSLILPLKGAKPVYFPLVTTCHDDDAAAAAAAADVQRIRSSLSLCQSSRWFSPMRTAAP